MKKRPGWQDDGPMGERFTPVRGSEGTVRYKRHPVTHRHLFHACAWNRLSLEPLVDFWTTDRVEAVRAVEAAFK